VRTKKSQIDNLRLVIYLVFFMCACNGGSSEMTQGDLMKYGIAAGILFAAYKFGGKMGAAAAVAVGAVVVAKQVPYLKQVV
jgi:hypothetical protein